ncbi:MAG: methyltransferase domain-containing protein [Proteobacteria bacterium]|nr:methyltransferase domain-containing protein [Pseudomonadota bacterium]
MHSSVRRRQAPPVHALAATIAAPVRPEPPETAEVTDLTRHGLTRFQAGDYVQASRIFTALVGGAPGRAVSWNHHALALIALGRDGEAANALRRSLEINPRQLQTWESLASALSRLARYDEAEAACRAALTLDGDSAAAWQVLAMVRTGQDDFIAAAEAFGRAIELEGESAGLCASRGAALIRGGCFEAAAEALEAAGRLDPASAPIAQARGLSALILAALAPPEAGGEMRLAGTAAAVADDMLKSAVLLLDARGERRAAGRIAELWLARRPDDVEARHLCDALLDRPVARQPAELVARNFDDLAHRFDEHLVQRLGYDGPEKLAALLAPLGPPAATLEVLDLGCGTGLCAPVLRPYAKRLVGLDLSPGMLEKARARSLYDGLDRADLIEALAAPERRPDLIVAFDTFPYLGALEPVFAAAAEALAPGGWFAFSTEDAEGGSYVLHGNGRFAHSAAYVETLADGRFAIVQRMGGVLRREAGRPLAGGYYLLRAL